MKKEIFGICLAVLSVLLMTQCTVKKRHYTKGFFVSTAKKRHPVKHENKEKDLSVTRENKTTLSFSENPNLNPQSETADLTIYASAENNLPPVVSARKLRMPPDSCSDLITFMNGDELKVKIEEISPDYISYRRCDYLTGPLIKTSPENIFRIKYGNGLVKVFQHVKPLPSQQVPGYGPNNQPVVRKTNGLAVASFVISLFSWLFLPGPVALILGIISLSQFKNHPEKYKGKWMATIGVILGAIGTLLLLIIILASV